MRLSSLGDGPIYFEIDEAGLMNVKEGFAPDGKNCTEINDKSFVHQNDEKTLKELEMAKKIAKKESGPLQWDKIILCVLMIAFILTVNILQPTSTHESPLGYELCSVSYWLIIVVLLAVCGVITVVSIRINKREQYYKIRFGVNHLPDDPLYEGKNLQTLIIIGFVGGFVAGALGLGGGSIYNPAFLEMGMNPATASATGMFLVLISTINSVTINYMNGYLDVQYGLWVSSFALVGSIAGLMSTDYVVRKTGK